MFVKFVNVSNKMPIAPYLDITKVKLIMRMSRKESFIPNSKLHRIEQKNLMDFNCVKIIILAKKYI